MNNQSKETNNSASVGIVETQYYQPAEKIKLESGLELEDITIAYETYGKLNP